MDHDRIARLLAEAPTVAALRPWPRYEVDHAIFGEIGCVIGEGERELLEAHQVLSGSGDAGRSRALLAAQALAECYQRMGRIEEAAKWRGGGASSATLQP